jgi:uncharacterized protein
VLSLSPTRLVVVQATPFCNLDCQYCYLPHRSQTDRITHDTIDRIVSRLREWGRFSKRLNVLWHSGEPLVLGPDFYRTAFDQFATLASSGAEISHAIQTNATLVTDAHCDLFREYKVSIGVSIDGPQPAHDAYRTTRSGAGTFNAAVAGLKRMQSNGLNPAVIAVLSSTSMRDPEAFYNCFAGLGVRIVGLNIQEKEAATTRSLEDDPAATESLYASFLRQLFLLSLQQDGPIFREFIAIVDVIDRGHPVINSESSPGAILSFSHRGTFGTLSPELLEISSLRYGSFSRGDIHKDRIEDALTLLISSPIGADIASGIEACASTCPYFALCGGGSPANKLGEKGSLSVTETFHCRFTKKTLIDLVASLLADPDIRTRALHQLKYWRQHRVF